MARLRDRSRGDDTLEEEPGPLQSAIPKSAASVRAERASLVVLGAAAFMAQADARVIDALLHVISDDFKTAPARASIVISAYALPYGLFQLFYGPIGDRIGKLRVMMACLSFFSIGTFACGFVPNLASFAVLRFLTGVAAAAVVPMSLGYIGDKFPYETRQIALGRFMSALMMGQIAGATLGGVFGEFLGWRNVFFAFGVAAAIVSVLLARESRRFPEKQKTGKLFTPSMFTVPAGGSILFAGMVGAGPPLVTGILLTAGGAVLLYALATQYGYILKRQSSKVILATVFTEGLFVFGGLAYLASSLTDRFGVAYSTAGLMLAGFGVGGLFYSFSVKKLFTRIGDLGILLLGGALLGAAFVAIGLIPNWQSFIPLVIVLGMGFYTMHGTLQTRATEMAPEARGAAISLFAFAFFMGQSVGPIALGHILEARGYSAAFVTAGIGLIALALIGRTLFVQIR
ncbi:MAG TPA: MFS transporter, partial [Terriglobia bacterium]|nr:MFS transporter [Terriglobia bacterium]